jgi:hypothetical protein
MRPRRRADERGAALFIVVLIVVLLTAIGAFAAHATSLTQTASGYSRRAASAFYLAEFATNLVASDMASDPNGYLARALTGQLGCRANTGYTPPAGSFPPCLPVEYADMVKKLDTSITADTDGAVFGALSRPDRPDDQAIKGSFRLEITDVSPAPDAQLGMAMNGVAQAKVWRSVYSTQGRVVPSTSSTTDCTEEASRASETQGIRGIVIFTTLGNAMPTPGAI